MNPISLCMIVKNESQCIAKAIDSVKDYISEIIICDNFSDDDTVKILEGYNPKVVIQRELDGDYAQLRNYLWEHVSNDWTLWLDADEIFERSVCDWFGHLLEYAEHHNIDFYGFIRRTFIDGKLQNPLNIDFQRRLCKRTCRWISPLHEYIIGRNGLDTALVFDHIKTNDMQKIDQEQYDRWEVKDNKWVFKG